MRECEIKFPVEGAIDRGAVRSRIETLSIIEHRVRNEIDFVPDDEQHAMRRSGILLRFSRVANEEGHVRTLVTLKVQRRNRRLQDHNETEFHANEDGCVEKAGEVSSLIEKKSGISIAPHRLAFGSFDTFVVRSRSEFGLNSIRALIEKDREIYHGTNFDICIDSFPELVGQYLEVSATTPKGVTSICRSLDLAITSGDSRTYGQIVEQALRRSESPHPRVLLSPKNRTYSRDAGIQ